MRSAFLSSVAVAVLLLAAAEGVLTHGTKGRWYTPRETTKAEEQRKASGGYSPVPTSSPEHVVMDLLRRQDNPDYVLPSDICGWYQQFKSRLAMWLEHPASTSGVYGAAVTALHSRACPHSSQHASRARSGTPASLVAPGLNAGPTPSASSRPSDTPTPPPAATNQTPVGAIVGGTVASFALIVILILGILYYRHKKRTAAHTEEPIVTEIAHGSVKELPHSPSPDGLSPTRFSQHQPFQSYDIQVAPQQAVGYASPYEQPQGPVQLEDARQEPHGTPSPHLNMYG
ncbi:hypothetical protein QBC34DRAFT_424565 [Podospora aff. communis PSN243]|uniref:Uncharacterized protein n=1 Tax=Podospora aff. communis PSN243 TaxID=3040156 RepID=A0AAV9GQB1_9PEZI|nr:hypothetical protein QBC34DRAFT_424565 [Podospora aff. communis PSN243]